MNELVVYSGIMIVSVLVSSGSQIMLKKSALKKYDSVVNEYINPFVIIAYGLFFGSTLITMFALKVVPLSMAPILEATGYFFVPVLSLIFLKEKITFFSSSVDYFSVG